MSPSDSGKPAAPPEGGGSPRPQQLRAVMDDSVADGVYANIASIMSGPAEFFLDFGRVVPGKPEFRVFSRVIMTPVHAKQLAMALVEHLRQFESQHGEIRVLPEAHSAKPGVH